nr:DUF885 domain-containing protein [Saliniradius amylolyticus]
MILLLIFSVCFSLVAQAQSSLDRLLDEIWQFELRIAPVTATSLGVHDYDHLLADRSPEALKRQRDQAAEYLQRLAELDSAERSFDERLNISMQRYRLQNLVDKYDFNQHYVPLKSEDGFHRSIAYLPNRIKMAAAEDVKNYLRRLKALPRLFEQNIYWMKQGLQTGLTQPKVVLQGYESSVSAFIHDDPEDSVFFEPFKQRPVWAQASQFSQWATTARQIIASEVMPAYQSYYEFLTEQYIPNARDSVGIEHWPQGKAFYANRARHYTTTDMTVDEIHQLGLQEVKRIRAEMARVMQQAGFDGSHAEFIHFLRTDKQFYAESPKALLKQAAYLSKKADAILPKLFYKLPRTPYGVAPVPDSIAPKYTTGRYIGPTRDDQPGYYWVNTYALDKRPLYALPALTLHEAVPGHHLQNALAREMDHLPPVRRHTYISAFGEGWGLYSEYLGKEMGYYETPYDDFGRLSYEMWRACRLVVDTGMHMQGWSRQEAIDYMLENTALSEHNVTTEIDRYISWPGQALSYKIGEITIKRLRWESEQALGNDFDLRAFHDALLENGAIPLSALEQHMTRFIEQHQ